jgi:hypothetical protein
VLASLEKNVKDLKGLVTLSGSLISGESIDEATVFLESVGEMWKPIGLDLIENSVKKKKEVNELVCEKEQRERKKKKKMGKR